MNIKVHKNLPKVMLALILPALVMLCVLCAGYTSMFLSLVFCKIHMAIRRCFFDFIDNFAMVFGTFKGSPVFVPVFVVFS